MPVNRRLFLGAAVLTAAGWAAQRAGLVDAVGGIGGAVSGLDEGVTGFARRPFEARCAAGHCVHDGWAHITQGWDPAGNAFVPSHFRTKDFIIAEKALGPLGMAPTVFNEAASFAGRIWRGPGYDTVPAVMHDDLTTDAMYSSESGAAPWQQEAGAPPVPRECAALLAHDGHLYQFLGVRYNASAPPTYVNPRDAWRMGPDGVWVQRSADLGIERRSFGYVSWGGAIFILAGADDLQPPPDQNYRTVYNEVYRSDDGMQSLTFAGNATFGPRYGARAATAWGHVVVSGGATNAGGFSEPGVYTNEVWASNDPDLLNWFPLAPLPQALMHHVMLCLPVDGVETLAVIGGYNNATHPGGGPLGTIYTLDSLAGQWQARPDSDFWVA